MLIAILSDTHNNLNNLNAALAMCRAEGVETVIHCGDLTAPETARLLDGFRVLLTFGNGDAASGEIAEILRYYNSDSQAGMIYTGELGGKQIAAAHGHEAKALHELVASGRYDYVFRGHSHQHIDEMRGRTRVINPGALGGLHREPRQFCLLEVETGEARFVRVEEDRGQI